MKEPGIIALASCDPFPPVVDDEEPLRQALRRRGFAVCDPPWDSAHDWASCDAVLLRTTWDYHLRADEFLAWCDATSRVTRLVHGPHVVRWNADKRYLAELARLGIAIAPTAWVDAATSPDTLAAHLAGAPRALLKPVVGANAALTLRFDNDHDGRARAAAHLDAHPAAFMLQPYLASVEREGELSVLVIDGEPSGGVRKLPAPGDYRVQEDWGASDEPWTPDAAALSLARAALLGATSILGEPLLYARADLLVYDGGYVLNELELVEPAFFFRHHPVAAERLAAGLVALTNPPASA